MCLFVSPVHIVYFWEPTPPHFKYSLVYLYLQDRNVEKHFTSTVAEILKHASSGTQTNSSETLGGQNLARNPHLTWKDIMTNISSRPRPRSWSDLAPSHPLPAWQCLNQTKLEPWHFIDPCGNYNNYDNMSRVVPAAAPRKWFARTGNPRTRGDSERPIRGELIEFRLFCYSGRGRGG